MLDESALIDALRNSTIAGAGLVFAKEPPCRDNPVLQMDNLVVTSYNGGGDLNTMRRIIGPAFDNIMTVERGELLPELELIKA